MPVMRNYFAHCKGLIRSVLSSFTDVPEEVMSIIQGITLPMAIILDNRNLE